MPTFRNRNVVEIARGIKAFLNLEAGVTRSVPSATERPSARAGKGRGIRPENVVWIFGFGRSGSTWLSRMMGEFEDQTVWPEPLIGALFGRYYYTGVQEVHRKSPWFIMGSRRGIWLKLIRSFVLDGASEWFPRVARRGGILVVKVQNGAVGAPLLVEALPESRVILLVRDPRDMVASALESLKEGSWGSERLGIDTPMEVSAETWAGHYLQYVGKSKEAYDAHKGPKTLIRYEDLRSDTLGTMKRLYSELSIDVDEEGLARVVEKHSWENVPAEKKGEGKFFRKATPGAWREDLTPEQAETVERITAPLLAEFYSA